MSGVGSVVFEFILAGIVTIGFSILFQVPKKELLYIGIAGGICWSTYSLLNTNTEWGSAISTMFATFVTTVFCRCVAVIRNCPLTVYLLSGVICLVPGGGIYFTSYYLMNRRSSLALSAGLGAVEVAAGIALGISLGFGIPQKVFFILKNKINK